jgi:hypothetical protein
VEASRHVSTRLEGRARKQGGEVQCGPGVVLTFYRGRGSAVEVVTYDNGWSNGLNAIDGRGWLGRGLNQGFKSREG